MKRMRVGLLAVSGALLVVSVGVSAHHSFAAAFDGNKPITVKGVITAVRLENPHSWLFLDAKDASGRLQQWAFEASAPTSLIRSGFTRDLVKPGDEVIIRGYHARDMSRNAGAARELVLADGRALAVGPGGLDGQ